jgi:hypothetical protein
MNLLQKNKTEDNIISIEAHVARTTSIISGAIRALNDGYNALWNLKIDELTSVLQYLYDNGKIGELFTNHYITATYLNTIQDSTNTGGVRAISTPRYQIEVIDGVVRVVIPEVEDIDITPIIDEP